jgi:DNA modification methylase
VKPYYESTSIQIYLGDALTVLQQLPSESVHCCVTSPPYWGLRDYGTATWEGGDVGCAHKRSAPAFSDAATPKNGHKHGFRHGTGDTDHANEPAYREVCGKCGATRIDSQLGLERTPEEYISRMVEVFREVKRVLREDGTLWLNMGDSYAVQGGQKRDEEESARNAERAARKGYNVGGWSGRTEHIQRCTNTAVNGLKPKDLCGIPWMLAFALRADGWYLRRCRWAKPNPMPESVTDRPTKSHEYIFLLSKSQSYYYDAEAIKEESIRAGEVPGGCYAEKAPEFGVVANRYAAGEVPAFRNKRTVWDGSDAAHAGRALRHLPRRTHQAVHPGRLPDWRNGA